MSLLMDALKRAEAAKQEAGRVPYSLPDAATDDSLSLEPIPGDAARTGTNPLPDLATHLDAVDADLASAALPESRPAAAPTRTVAPGKAVIEPRDAVRNAFAAKQAVPPPSRLPLWLALGTLGVAGIVIGGYVWYQMNSMNRSTLAVVARPVAPAASQPLSQPAPPPAPPADFGQNLPPTVAFAPPPADTPLFAPRRDGRSAPQPSEDDEVQPSQPIKLVRTRPELDANLVRGHATLQRGELEPARRDYEQALQRDPNNTDALLALAAIAQRQGRAGDAEGWRQRALIANPSDPATQAAALSGVAAEADPQTAESRLKTLLSTQPESAPLNFALGNLYARQSRWAEAQQVYFNAVAADGDNPDYLFNLAVSLDHLRQPRLAAQHYRLALDAATRRPAAFDRDKLNRRLGELQAEPLR
jgi:tetratricopeptide (TPR) repeat protein